MLRPWERIAMNPEEEQQLLRNWGLYYSHKQKLQEAKLYYDKSLALKADDHRALHYRAICKRNIAQTESALKDDLEASKYVESDVAISLGICDALYGMNQFELAKIEMHDNTHNFSKAKANAFKNGIDVIDENFKDLLGKSLGPFILKNEMYFNDVLADYKRRTNIDSRPLWKILKEQQKCDVLSVLEKEEVLLSPREIARRNLAFMVFFQMYFNKNCADVVFLRKLRENPNMMLKQMTESTPFLKSFLNTHYVMLRKFIKMLHARSPLYNEQLRKSGNKEAWEAQCEKHLNRVQYQTRRNTLATLRAIKELRREGKIQKLTQYVENIMGDYIVLKTQRVLPWKFEFINEVYNTLALAIADRFTVPLDFENVPLATKLTVLFRLPLADSAKEQPKFVFGDKSTYLQADAIDHPLIANKKMLARLEKRKIFAKYSIERSYLQHEIARNYLKQSRFDECCSAARKGCEEAKQDNNTLWQMLNVLLICKSYVSLQKLEKISEVLGEALTLAKHLRSAEICSFIQTCISVRSEQVNHRNRIRSFESQNFKRRSKMSLFSQKSDSLHNEDDPDESSSITLN